MTDDDNYLQSSRRFRISADVTALMLKGAGYAALGCSGLVVIAMILLGISAILPEASKEAADPTPEFSMAAPVPAPPYA
jgi:hypothetical protein